MATPIFVCGAECGATAVCAGHWDTLTGTALALETTIIEPGGGANSYKWIANGAASYLGHTLAQKTAAARIYFRFATFPTLTPVFFQLNQGSDGGVMVKSSPSGQIYIRMGASAGDVAVGSPITTGGWHYLDLRVDGSGTTTYLYAKLDGGTEASDSVVKTSENIISVRQGFTSTATAGTLYIDQTLVSAMADYPIGPTVTVAGFRPTSDGTHTSTSTNIVKGTTAVPIGAAITSATTDAWQWVDAATISTVGNFINQQTLATQYVEVGFGTIAVAPLAVEVLVSLSAASTAAGTQKSVLWDGVTASDMYALGTIGTAHPALKYQRAIYTASMSGAWTVALFNALHFRWGYSTDATPDMYLDNVVLEVAYVPATGTTCLPTAASMTLAGDTPTVAVTANILSQPGGASMTATGGTPAVLAPRLALPGGASLTASGVAPPIALSIFSRPTGVALTTTGSPPAIVLPVVSLPSAASMTASGGVPSITVAAGGITALPGAASMTASGATPAVALSIISRPTAASLTASGGTPAVVAIGSASRQPTPASLTATGAVPSVVAIGTALALPTAGSMTVTGVAPTVTVSAAGNYQPTAASMALTGATPTVVAVGSASRQPTSASLVATGAVPTVVATSGVIATPSAASLAMTAFAPTVALTDNRALAPVAAVLTLALFAPLVVATAAALAGRTLDQHGDPIDSCTVDAFDSATNVFYGTATSDSAGRYSIAVLPGVPYFLVAYKGDEVFGASARDLTA